MNPLSFIRKGLSKIGIDFFIISLFLVVILAHLFPSWGSKSSPLPLDTISNWGIALIFFFYGLKLSPEKLKSGLKNVRLHFIVQISTFIIFPIIVWIGEIIFQPDSDDLIWTGIYLLAALPSTISSSVVMVNMARGNVPAAIFNASISALIGVLMTPLIMEFFLSTTGGAGLDLKQVTLDLIVQVVLPVGLGILLYPYLGKHVAKTGKLLNRFDQSVILLIVFMSFAESFEEGFYELVDTQMLVIVTVAMMVLFLASYFSITKICGLLNFSIEDTITAAFCGSKKSLVHGTVMSNIFFTGSAVGIILLPLMVYHTLQLIAASMIAQRLAKRPNKI